MFEERWEASLRAVGAVHGALRERVDGLVATVRRRERMSSIDTAWLRMDSPSNLMMIVGVHVFETAVDFERLCATIETRLLPFPRFRQRVVQDLGGAWWELAEDFDLALHVHRLSLPGNGGKAELEALVSDLVSQELDHGKPLWQMHLVENYNGPNGEEQALIVRIHHCIADGIALISVLMALTDSGPDSDSRSTREAREDEDARERESNPWEPVFAPIRKATIRAMEWTARTGTDLSRRSIEFVTSREVAGEYAKAAARLARDVAEIALMQTDSATRFKGKPGISKVVAWTEPLPLAEVKAVSKAIGASVNDILLSSVAGALRAYLVDHGDDVSECEIRAMVPVNLRPAGEEYKLGNRFGLVPLVLPVGMENPVERLFEVKRRMAILKTSFQPLLAMGVLGAVGFAPRAIQTQALNLLSSKATAVMTNVPGPARPLYMAGAKMSQVMFWVPQSGDIGMGVSILSYGEGVQFGLITDKKLVADPQRVIDGFGPEFERLVMTLLLAPWEEGGAATDAPRPSPVEPKKSLRARRSRKSVAPISAEPAATSAPRKPSAFARARAQGRATSE